MMKRFPKTILSICALAILLFFQACTTTTDDTPGGGDIELSLSSLVGRWGIVRSSESGGTSETLIACQNTLEIQENGDFLFVNAAEGEWGEGSASFNPQDSTLTINMNGGSEMFKLLSISENGFELEFNDDRGGTIVVGTDEFVKLNEGEDCASITSAAAQKKWSIEELERGAYAIEEGGLGDLLGTESFDNIPYNMFTIEFKSGSAFIMIDLFHEYRYGVGTYRNLDDHNFVLSFDDDESSDQTLLHITGNSSAGLTFMIAEEDDDNEDGSRRIISEFSLKENDGSEPIIEVNDLISKWSATAVTERALLEGQVVAEETNDDIPSNKLTIEFFDDNSTQLIDLVDEIGFDRGDYTFLDGSNVLINVRGDDGDEEEREGEIFHVISASAENLVLKSFNAIDDHEDGDNDDLEHDLREFELSLAKNSGDEPSISADEILGTWEITEIEELSDEGEDNEGPVVGMLLTFVNDGSGEVTLNGEEVSGFEYEFLDSNNLKVSFDDGEGDGGEANDGHEDDEQDNYSIFHVTSNQSGLFEIVIFEPDRGDDENHGGDDEEDHDGDGATFRVVMQKQG